MKEQQKNFPALLEELRLARRMSKTDLAKLANLTPGYVSHLTLGGRKAPSEETVKALADALGVDVDERETLLEAAGYSSSLKSTQHTDKALYLVNVGNASEQNIGIAHKEDWGDAPNLEHFYGRERELTVLKKWIVDDHCRAVALLGLGGVGKTTLAVELAKRIKADFTHVIWCSLRDAPPASATLKKCIQFIAGPDQAYLPQDEYEQLELLKKYVRNYRCLIILDNLESILESGNRAGQYSAGREGYSRLISALSESQHKSCLLLTSREKPKEIAFLERTSTRVHTWQLVGVGQEEGRAILSDRGLFGEDETVSALIQRYAGNPLALKLASAPIHELYGGDISAFLQSGVTITGDIQELLNTQFERLSPDECKLLYWLAIEREAVTLNDLRKDSIQPASAEMELREALNSLHRRSLIEINSVARFSLQPVIMEYMTGKFVENIFQEIETGDLDFFKSHALIKAQTKDYLRDSQMLFILSPLAERLFLIAGKEGSEQKLRVILRILHETPTQTPGYAAGNVINLLMQLKCDLRGYDFSHLVIWQAYLQGAMLSEVDFSGSDLAQSMFTDMFGGVLAIALSPDNDLLAAGTTNSEIRIWRASDGMPLFTFEGHADWVRTVAFSLDGSLLASGSDDQTVRIWDVRTGQSLKVLAGHSGRVYSVAFSPDSSLLASGSEDQTVRIWELKGEDDRDNAQALLGHTNRVRSVAFSPDGSLLASGSEDLTVRLWELGGNKAYTSRILEGHQGKIWSVAFHPASKLLASGSEDQTVRIWEVSTASCSRILTGHTRAVRSVAFHPAGKLLASGSRDQVVRLWKIETGECVETLRGHSNLVMSVSFNVDGSLLASGSEDQTIRIWEVETRQCLKILQGYSTLRYAVAFSPDGQLLANGNEDQTVRLWDMETAQCIKILEGHTNRTRTVAFSPDGQLLVSGSDDQTIRLWDVSSGQCLRSLYGHKDWIKSVAFSPDGSLIASGSDDQTIRLWDVRSGQCLKVLRGHKDWIWSIAFSPDGKTLASGGEDQIVRLWDLDSMQSCEFTERHSNAIWSVAFSPDGKVLASGSWDQTIRLWDVQTGQCLKLLEGHEDLVESVAFSPDGKLLASGSWDQAIRLWDVSSGQLLNVLKGHTSWLYSVAFNPQGDYLASSSGDGTIKIWNVQEGHAVKTLKSDRPYERMNISGVTGLTDTQRATLKALGAVEE